MMSCGIESLFGSKSCYTQPRSTAESKNCTIYTTAEHVAGQDEGPKTKLLKQNGRKSRV